MNLEIASRLAALRKENNLSQEGLAEKLGISRQAVSKWERAEASPDTDNLIALAKLYHVSLDELLKIHEEDAENESLDAQQQGQNADAQLLYSEDGQSAQAGNQTGAQGQSDTENVVSVGFGGIHVKDKDGKVSGHLFAHGKDDKDGKDVELHLGIIAVIAYIIIGSCFGAWHPGWLIFLCIPLVSTFIQAVRFRNADIFAYPVLAVVVFFYVGLIHDIWHPTWVVFLTIPVYYSITGYIRRKYTKDVEEYEESGSEIQ